MPIPPSPLIAFSTADVVVFGVRLSLLAERYANLEPSQQCVTGITVRLLPDKSGGGAAG